MNNLWDLFRHYDFSIYYSLYSIGIKYQAVDVFYYSFAKYGIALFLFSFTYLIWMKRINAFLCSFIAMGLGGLMDLVIFTFWRRPRPFISHDYILQPAIDRLSVERVSSFPSSHTYVVFAIATSIYLYGHRRLGATLFILAICVAIGRIGTGLHYPSDTIAGAILGIVSGILAHRFVQRNEKHWEYRSGMDDQLSND